MKKKIGLEHVGMGSSLYGLLPKSALQESTDLCVTGSLDLIINVLEMIKYL